MKKSFGLIIFFATFLLIGCTSQPEGTLPSVILSEEEMVDVMADVQIMESAISYKKSTNGMTEYLKTCGFDTVFSHHGITDSIFIENFDYYAATPEVLERIMDSVVVRITEMRAVNDTMSKKK